MRVVVGRIGRPHGIRGEVTVEPRTDEPDLRFADGATLLVDDRADLASLEVERAHWHSGRLLVAFHGVDDRNAAEALRGVLLSVDRDDDAVADEDDAYYDTSLVGCRVELADGTAVGTVTQVVHLPAQDLLAVARTGSAGSSEVLIPFVAAICPVVDITAKRIVIDPPEGLLDAPDLDSPDV